MISGIGHDMGPLRNNGQLHRKCLFTKSVMFLNLLLIMKRVPYSTGSPFVRCSTLVHDVPSLRAMRNNSNSGGDGDVTVTFAHDCISFNKLIRFLKD